MKKYLWIMCVAAFLPGCLSQAHYDELMGQTNDIKVLKEHDQNQDQQIQEIQRALESLQSRLKTEIQTSGVKVEQPSTRAIKVTLPQAVLFNSGSTQIDSTGRSVLAKVAEGLRSAPDSTIRIVGHSDALPIGKKLSSRFTDNWELSAARAAAVARVFVWGEDISKTRVRVEGVNAVDQVADDSTAGGRAKNRRIEVFIASFD